MTITIAWTRTVSATSELLIASDSRLTSAGHVDVCQKIFPLQRGDSFFGFCGQTILAFPIVFQIISTIANFKKYQDRTKDVIDLVSVILAVINSFGEAWRDTVVDDERSSNMETKFIFGGWSWKRNKFYVFPIHYNIKTSKFQVYTHKKKIRALGLADDEKCIVIGNYAPEFYQLLREELAGREAMDYEPLRVLSNMLQTNRFIDRRSSETFYVDKKPGLIGGAPQVLKIYKHSNVKPIAIRWPNSDKGKSDITLFGRHLFSYEKTLNTIYDPIKNSFLYPLEGVSN